MMNDDYVFTEENAKKLRDALEMERYMVVEVKPFEVPMVHLLRGLAETAYKLDTQRERLQVLKEEIEHTQKSIHDIVSEQDHYEQTLTKSHGAYAIDQFINRVEQEHQGIFDTKKKVAPKKPAPSKLGVM
jgi:Mg2+ and Co2+ transporter CorA